MSYSPDDEPTGPLPNVTQTTSTIGDPVEADRVQWGVDGVDPRDPLGLGRPPQHPTQDVHNTDIRDPEPHDTGQQHAAGVGRKVGVGREVGLDELWDQAVALTREQDEADIATSGPVVPPIDPAFLPPVMPGPQPRPGGTPPLPPVEDPAPEVAAAHEPTPLSSRWRAGIAAAVAVAAVTVAIVVARLASSSPAPTPSQAGNGGPAFVLPTSQPAQTSSADAALAPPPGLAALPPPAAKPSPTRPLPVDAPSVTVLNQTRVHGLAAKEADVIRLAGWTVRRVTNVNARQPSTTVYYDPSQQAAAKALIASVPSVKVALPRPRYLLRTGGLIVVVAADAA